jgi:hypothetical protein
MTARKDQPAALKRRIAILEERLAEEMRMHDKMRNAWRDAVFERAHLRDRLDAALAALQGRA